MGRGPGNEPVCVRLHLTFCLMRDTTSTWLATLAPSLAAVSAMARFIRESLCCPVKGGVGKGEGGWRGEMKKMVREENQRR